MCKPRDPRTGKRLTQSLNKVLITDYLQIRVLPFRQNREFDE